VNAATPERRVSQRATVIFPLPVVAFSSLELQLEQFCCCCRNTRVKRVGGQQSIGDPSALIMVGG
jgi:hypothetical protein